MIRKEEHGSLLGTEIHSDLYYLEVGAIQFSVGCQRLKLSKIDLRPQSELQEITNPEWLLLKMCLQFSKVLPVENRKMPLARKHFRSWFFRQSPSHQDEE